MIGMDKKQSGIEEKDKFEFNELPEGDGVIVINSDRKILASNLQAERIFRRRFIPGEVLKTDHIIRSQYKTHAPVTFFFCISQ